MLNFISFDQQPDNLILNPYSDPGLCALSAPDFLWRSRPRANIQGFAASEHASINAKIEAFLTRVHRHKVFRNAVEFNTFPVVLTDAWFKKSHATAMGKCVIGGASGIRLLNRYSFQNATAAFDPEAALNAYFDHAQSAAIGAKLPLHNGPLPPDTPFAIESRNTFNYFHFISETLCQLCSVAETPLTGPIYIHYPNRDDKTRGFVMGFIRALFPELADRIILQRAPFHHPLAVGVYNFLSSYYHMPDAQSAGLDAEAPSTHYWKGRTATRNSHSVLEINSVDSNLYKLRDRALKAIEGMDTSHLPRRFWVGRDDTLSRARLMKGEEELIDMLGLFEFESVVFERLSPLEQIAIMANAEMMVSYHGAGFTNMLFAAPDAWVVEIGTLQTAIWRWGDFWRLAHVSGCRYVSFFADFNKDDPLEEPVFSEESIVPVHLSANGRARVMSFIVAALGHVPNFARAADLLILAQQLIACAAYDGAERLFARHEALMTGHVDLCLLRAECHKHRQEWNAEFIALHAAYEADPTRWQTLVQILWYARKVDNARITRWALALLRADFPDRADRMVSAFGWLQKAV